MIGQAIIAVAVVMALACFIWLVKKVIDHGEARLSAEKNQLLAEAQRDAVVAKLGTAEGTIVELNATLAKTSEELRLSKAENLRRTKKEIDDAPDLVGISESTMGLQPSVSSTPDTGASGGKDSTVSVPPAGSSR